MFIAIALYHLQFVLSSIWITRYFVEIMRYPSGMSDAKFCYYCILILYGQVLELMKFFFSPLRNLAFISFSFESIIGNWDQSPCLNLYQTFMNWCHKRAEFLHFAYDGSSLLSKYAHCWGFIVCSFVQK